MRDDRSRPTSRIVAELPLPEIDDIQPAIGRRHPKQTGSIAVNRDHAVVADAGRIGVIVSKVASEPFGPPVEVKEARHWTAPRIPSPIIEKRAAVQHRRPGAERILDDAPAWRLILDQPDVRGRGQHPEIAGSSSYR